VASVGVLSSVEVLPFHYLNQRFCLLMLYALIHSIHFAVFTPTLLAALQLNHNHNKTLYSACSR